MSLDVRARQQQIDAMRGELQGAGTRLAAQRQQGEQQSAMLTEQLAIAQAVSADTKTALEEAVQDGQAAKGLLQAERESTTLLSKAREAAVQVRYCQMNIRKAAAVVYLIAVTRSYHARSRCFPASFAGVA